MVKRKKKQRSKSASKTTAGTDQLKTIVQTGVSLHQKGDFSQCLKLVSDVAESCDAKDQSLFLQVLFLAVSSAYNLGKYSEAANWVDKALALNTSIIDFDYFKAVLTYCLRQYDDSVTACKHIIEKLEADDTVDGVFMPIKNRLPEIHGTLGMVYYQLERFPEAETQLEKAIALNNDTPEFYINLSQVRARMGDTDGERRAVSDGLVHCNHKDELARMATRFLAPQTISLCMIVKNEERLLPRCLKSVKDLVDEIIIVDTGSEDKTVEIAESFGAKIYHHPWQQNFSLHRNQSINYATSEWILIMDADEELARSDHDKLRAATRIPDINVVSISVHNQNLDTGEVTSFLTSIRLWRRKLNGYYEGIVHNELRLPPDEPVLRADVKLMHYGYGLDKDKMVNKLDRTKTLLKQQLRENPNNAFANYNYSQLLRGEQEQASPEACKEIIEHSGRTVANTDPDLKGEQFLHVSALDQMSVAYFYLREYDKAAECSLRALEIDPNYIDPMFNLGHIYSARCDFPRAIKAFNDYLDFVNNYDVGDEINNYILQHTNKQAEAHFGLGLVYERTGQNNLAIENFLKVFNYKKDHLDVHTHLAHLYLGEGDYPSARKHAEQRLERDEHDLTAKYILAEVLRLQGQLEAAGEQYRAIVEIEPEHKAALKCLVDVHRQLGQQDQALQWVDRLLAIIPNDYHSLNSKAEILIARENYSSAMQVYKDMLKSFPDDADLFNNLGNCHFKNGEFNEAVTNYNHALTIKPQLEVALRNIGYCYFKLGDQSNAVDKLKVYLQYVPDDLDILYLVARMLFDRSEYSNTIPYLEKCVTIVPNSPEMVSLLADCYLKLGHLESARQGYRQAINIDPNFQPAQIMLAEVEKLTPSRV